MKVTQFLNKNIYISHFFLIITFGILVSCGGSPIEILSYEARVERHAYAAGDYESLSFFVNVPDIQSYKDIDQIIISHPATGLTWTLSEANWLGTQDGNDIWIGSSALSMADYSPLPRGDYICTIRNLAGKDNQVPFAIIKKLKTPPSINYSFTQKNQPQLQFRSTYTDNFLLAYNLNKAALRMVKLNNSSINLRELLGPDYDRANNFILYGFDAATSSASYALPIDKPQEEPAKTNGQN